MTLDGIIWIFPIFEILEFGWVLIPMQTAVCLLPKMRKYCWVPFVACIICMVLSYFIPMEIIFQRSFFRLEVCIYFASAAAWLALGLLMGGILVWTTNHFKRKE